MSSIATKSVFNTGNLTGYEEIVDENVSNDLQNDLSINNFVDVHQKKMSDEDSTLPENWNDLTVREQRNRVSEKIRDHYKNLPESLVFLIEGNAVDGDCGRPFDATPEWLDRKKFERGQRFAMDNYLSIMFAEVISLHMNLSIEESLKVLIVTGKSSEPFTAFKRYLTTVKRIRNWYKSDVWTKGTAANLDMRTVRNIHANIRKKMNALSYEKIDEASTIMNTWSPDRAKIRQDFQSSCQAPAFLFSNQENEFNKSKGFTQSEMSMTQFAFMGLVTLYPDKFGIHGATEEDIEAFCHLWKGIGYLLGIKDEFNFCRGSLEEIKERARDFIEYWIKPNLREVTPEWEHMMRCLTEGVSYYFPRFNYETSLLYFADVVGIPMPRVRKSLSFISWIRLYLMKFNLNFTVRFPGIMKIINWDLSQSIDRALLFTDEELAALQKRSEITLAKGIADTIAVRKNSITAESSVWHGALFFVFSTLFLLLISSMIMKTMQYK